MADTAKSRTSDWSISHWRSGADRSAKTSTVRRSSGVAGAESTETDVAEEERMERCGLLLVLRLKRVPTTEFIAATKR
jgi:hypothetical protein